MPSEDIKDWLAYAVMKERAWSFQHETRVVADFESPDAGQGKEVVIPRIDYLKLPIWFEMLDKIVITFSPWMGTQMKDMLKRQIKDIDLGIDVKKIIFKNSKFDGLIIRK